MRLTEMLHYYNNRTIPTQNWMKYHYSHFSPTAEDKRLREEYQKNLKRSKKAMKIKDIFG